MSQSEQTQLVEAETTAFDYTPRALMRDPTVSSSVTERELQAWGLSSEWLGAQPDETPFDTFYRYQYDQLYFFPVGKDENGDPQDYFPVEFRTYINTVGEPRRALKDNIREVVNPRVRTLFNSGPYRGFMDGFNFVYHSSNIEDEEVDADDANNLGIPQFEVAVWKNGSLQGNASGFFDNFRLEHQSQLADHQEKWELSKNPTRDSYQISPRGRTSARERAKNIRGKTVYLNGLEIGSVTTDGRVWLKNEYLRGPTYRGQHSRAAVIDQTTATPQALREGGVVYKVGENQDEILLVTATEKPDDFDPTPADDVAERLTFDDVETDDIELMLEDEAIDFEIRRDGGSMLGRYSTPEMRTITEPTDWPTDPYFG